MWTDEEKVYVDEKILQIEKEQPNAPGQVPFIKLKQILKYLSSSNRARAGVDELPDDKSLELDVGKVVKDIVVVQEDASVFPKVASKGLIAIERLPLEDQEAVSQGTQPSAKEQPPAKEDVIPSGEKMCLNVQWGQVILVQGGPSDKHVSRERGTATQSF
ncbi:hypothetical protein PCASD_05808 [Puccinia coronata f. sp. avenae]|uniref:Uncharacterized protein n=1 Tax=Puccinia coronata f. sp. avenae TaxID=200324 RepID=A0A2N5V1L1_9BASI|nr:hypothetical protein PCASD_05808 [Puccinia coronata f. sp. avenae]